MAKMAHSGTSWCSSSMARMASAGVSPGISTSRTSGLAACTRRMTGSDPATGTLSQVWTVRATLVPSTNTCSTVRCSLSVATITTERSDITCFNSKNQLPVFSCQLPAKFPSGSRRINVRRGLLPYRLFGIKLLVIHVGFRIPRSGRSFSIGRDPMHRAQDHQFRIAFLKTLTLEKITEDRNIPEAGNFVPNIGDTIIDQASDHEALPIFQLEFSLSLARAQGRNGEAGNSQRVGKIESADLRSNHEVNVAVGHD